MSTSEEQLTRIIAQAQTPVEQIDCTNGIKLKVAEPSGDNYLLAIELAGSSGMLIGFLEALLCVTAVNGSPEPKPRNRSMIDNLAHRIGRAGVDEVTQWYNAKVNPEIMQAVQQLGAQATPDNVRAAVTAIKDARVKNSRETQ